MLVGWFAHDLEHETQPVFGPAHQSPGVAAVGPHQRHTGHGEPQPLQQAPPAVAVLHTGRGDQHDQEQPEGVGDDVALGAVRSFPASYPR